MTGDVNIINLLIAFGAICGTITTIWALFEKISKPLREIATRLKNLEEWQIAQQDDLDDSKEERRIVCRGILALFVWAKSQGVNGDVKKSYEELHEFLSKKSHGGKSHRGFYNK